MAYSTYTGWSLKEIAKRFSDGITTHSESKGEMGNIQNPLLNLPMNRDLYFTYGVGEVSFFRDSIASYTDIQGFISYAQIDEPRFGPQGLLIEYQTTNLCAYSEDFNSSRWTNPLSSWSANNNVYISPDNTQNADKILLSKINNTLRLELSNVPIDTQGILSNMVADTYTFSFWINDVENNILGLSLNDTVNNYDILYTSKSEWVRVSTTFTANTFDKLDLNILTDGSLSNISIWGVQLEKESGHSSYIKTIGVGITRKADFIELLGLNNFPDTREYSASIQFTPNNISGGYDLFGGYNNMEKIVSLNIDNTLSLSSNVLDVNNIISKQWTPPTYIELESNVTYTFGTAFNNNNKDCNLYVNSEILPSTTNIVLNYKPKSIVDKIVLGGELGNSIDKMSGYIKNFKIYDKTLLKSSFSLI